MSALATSALANSARAGLSSGTFFTGKASFNPCKGIALMRLCAAEPSAGWDGAMQRILSIQYLRAWAAMMVVVYHALQATTSRFHIGAAGVDVFFVVSGFIMASLTFTKDATPASFMWRRIIRIVPLYWMATLLALALSLVRPNFFHAFDPSPENTTLSLLFIPHHSATGLAPVLGQGWTLEYEMFFYAVCALGLFLPPANRLKMLCALLALLVTLGTVLQMPGPMARVYTGPLLLEFMAGVALASLWCKQRMPRPAFGAAALVLGVCLFAAQAAHVAAFSGVRVLDWGVPAILLVLGALSLEAAQRVPLSQTGLLLGDASYSIYLMHGFVVSGFLWFFSDAPLVVRVLSCVAGTSILAICSHLWFERPVAAWLKSIRARLLARPSGLSPRS
jgi:exopolysaccharide production protein ExoZ